jgi:hypothetical protein
MLPVVLVMALGLEAAEVVESVAADRKELSLVIYNGNTSLVRETRTIILPEGECEIRLADVGRMLIPSSVIADPGANAKLIEQRYLFDPLNRQNLLDAFVGRKVLVESKDERTGIVESREAILLSNDGGPVLEIDGRVELDPAGRIILPSVPEGLVARPVLSWLVESGRAAKRDLSLSYLSNGMSWQCEYVLTVASSEKDAELGGWVTLRNSSGADFENATVHLIAGELNRSSRNEFVPAPQAMEMRTSLAAGKAMDASVEAEEQFEYYRYSLPRTIDMPHNQTLQVELFAPRKIEVEKIYRLSGSQRYYYSPVGANRDPVPARVILSWEVEGKQPLPAGLVRVYERESGGLLWFAGEDRISHTSTGEEVEISAGSAFDVKGLRRQVEFERPSDRLRRVTVEIELINGKDSAVTVQVEESIPGDWKVVDTTHDWDKLQSNLIRFSPRVPAGSRVKIRYTVEVL